MKLKNNPIRTKKSAFTLIELLIAMTMLAVIILVISVTISQIYFQQKKITIRQNFHNEARYLMEKIVQLARNNTLDYDEFFVHYGPKSNLCADFAADISGPSTNTQIPSFYRDPNQDGVPDTDDCLALTESSAPAICGGNFLYDRDNNDLPDNSDDTGTAGIDEGAHNRAALGYENIFYWDTRNDNEPDRQLGGFNISGGRDNCTKALPETNTAGTSLIINDLYLINGSRTVRTHIQYLDNNSLPSIDGGTPDECDEGECIIKVKRELAQDTDGDKRVDSWDTDCDVDNGPGDVDLYDDDTILGAPSAVDADARARYCQRAQPPINITPDFFSITDLNFLPSPNSDPYLASRVDDVQIQPHVFIDMQFELKDPARYRFTNDGPNTRLQTTASSRVFGDTRN